MFLSQSLHWVLNSWKRILQKNHRSDTNMTTTRSGWIARNDPPPLKCSEQTLVPSAISKSFPSSQRTPRIHCFCYRGEQGNCKTKSSPLDLASFWWHPGTRKIVGISKENRMDRPWRITFQGPRTETKPGAVQGSFLLQLNLSQLSRPPCLHSVYGKLVTELEINIDNTNPFTIV